MTMTLARAAQLVQEKLTADAPIALYEGKPVTKGKGRFGPFIKWNDMFINIPAKMSFDTLSQADCIQLIQAKVEKESNRYIQQWTEEGISIENGRWGPFIRFGKANITLKTNEGKRLTAEDATTLTLEEVKKMIVAEVPNAFDKKTKATKAKAPAKKK
jgi:DNA topoisomerase-1